ncbi:MAG: CehA/McbA family metallohydrolase [Bryobacteraceae bacterium]
MSKHGSHRSLTVAALKVQAPIALTALALLLPLCLQAQGQRRIFSRIMTGEPYTLECYLPQITNGPNFPTWSPDGKELAFAMKGSLWRHRLGEPSARELVVEQGYASQPAWSPDGNFIVYTVDKDETIHLKILDLRTGETKQLTSGNSINVEPEWSPDGRRIAYVSTFPNGNYNVYVMPLAAGIPGTPVQLTFDFELKPPTVYYGKWALHIHPTWTRDGKELILISNRDNKHGSGGFYRMKAEPGAKLERFHYEETTWKARPTLSPDGAKLVYSSYLGGQWQQLWAMPPRGGDAFPLTYGDFDRTTPRWSPDGSRIAFISNQGGDTSLWLWHWFGGRMDEIKVSRLVYKRPMGSLSVRVLDAATGKPMRARVHLNASDGRAYAPAESWFRADWLMFDHMDQSEYHYFHTDGDFTVELPPGPVKLAFSRGFEYLPEKREASVTPGGTVRLTVSLKRLENMAAKGWWDGDNHFHMNYSGVYFNTPKLLLEQAEGEDIHVLNNLICNKEQRIPDVMHFTGRPDKASTRDRVLFHAQEYHPPFWGHSTFLDLKKHLVIPDYVGYQNTVVASLFPSNTTPFRVTREQGGLAGYAHGAGPNFAADLALENVDFAEANAAAGMEPLYKAWNCGYKVVASAGEDAFPNFYRSYILGSNRVYVHSGPTLDYDQWTKAFRAGRSFVSSGPLVFLTVNGKEPGDELQFPGATVVNVTAEVKSITPVRLIEILLNGKPVETIKPEGDQNVVKVITPIRIDRSGWIGIRTQAQYVRDPIRRPFPFAATMPVWLIVNGKPVRSKADAQHFVDWMDKTWERARQLTWNNQDELETTRREYEQARQRMLARLQESEP